MGRGFGAIILGASDARRGPTGTIAVPAKRRVDELLEAMIIHSDNVACDKLLALLGGPGVVDARIKKLGVEGITIRYSELEMGTGKVDNTATATAVVGLLAKIARGQTGLSPASAKRLDDLLDRVATGPNRLKGALPAGTPVAHKTGTAEARDGKTDATNDVGLITLRTATGSRSPSSCTPPPPTRRPASARSPSSPASPLTPST
jgi:beta-lactamase class A